MTEAEARRMEYEEMQKSRPDLTYEEFKKEMGLDAPLGADGNLAGPNNPPKEYKLTPNQGGLGAAVLKPSGASNQSGAQPPAKTENAYPLLPDNSNVDLWKQEKKTEELKKQLGVEEPPKKEESPKSIDYPLLPDNSWMDIGKQEQKTKKIRREANAYRTEHEGENRMPLWGDSAEKKLVSEAYSLSKDEKLTDKQRKQIAEALPYLSDDMKKRIEEYGGFGETLKNSVTDNLRSIFTGESEKEAQRKYDRGILKTAMQSVGKNGAAARGVLEASYLGIPGQLEKVANKSYKEGNPYLTQATNDISREQHPNYYGAGYLVGEAALYKGLGTAAKGIKGLSKIKNPFLRDFAANAIADTAVNAG